MSTTYTDNYLAEILDHGFDSSEVKQTVYFFMQLKSLARIDAQGGQQECPQTAAESSSHQAESNNE